MSAYNMHTQSYIYNSLGVLLQDGQLVAFMEDPANKQTILQVSVNSVTTVVTFTPYSTAVIDGDIVYITNTAPSTSATSGQTWYYNNSAWVEAANNKVTSNQAPLFQLYDHNKVALNDTNTYPKSTFAGSKIFSYLINTTVGAQIDPVLKFPLSYNSLGQSTDIIFQNNLITNDMYTVRGRTNYGYYYYTSSTAPVYYNGWNAYTRTFAASHYQHQVSGL